MKQIRAIVYGVGKINQIATRLMVEKGVEIVGAVNRPGPKVGKDLGELAGISLLGIPVIDEPEKVLSSPAELMAQDPKGSWAVAELHAGISSELVNFMCHLASELDMT